MRERATTCLDARRQSRNRHARPEGKCIIDEMTRVAPLVLAFEAERERLAGAAHGRQDSLVEYWWSGDDRNHRLRRQLHVVVGGERIHQDLELESGLLERLHAQSGRTAPAIAKAHDDGIAFTQEAALHADYDGPIPGSDVPLLLVAQLQHRAVRGFGGDVIPSLRVNELRLAHVGGESMHDPQRTGVVDAEVARYVRERDGGEAASFKFAGWCYGRAADTIGKIGRVKGVVSHPNIPLVHP